MTVYQPGQRVALVHTTDLYTDLRPGDTGTVRRHHPHRNTVDVDWDSGSRLSMCLDDGDRIEPLDQATTDAPGSSPAAYPAPPQADPVHAGPRVPDEPGDDTPAWAATLARLAEAAADAGRGVAEWWAQDAVGGRSSGDVPATARKILTGITDGDPAVLDALPTFTPPPVWADGRDVAEVRYTEAAADEAPRWQDLTASQREQTVAASREAFDDAVLQRVTELCQLAASPTGSDTSHLHPDRIHDGTIGVFAGDWAATTGSNGAARIPVGYVGTLIDRSGSAGCRAGLALGRVRRVGDQPTRVPWAAKRDRMLRSLA
jgi:hypothetical protein